MDVFTKQDVFVDCLWETQWEDNNGKSSSGFIMLGQQSTLFLSLQQTIVHIQPALYSHSLHQDSTSRNREDDLSNWSPLKIKPGVYP